MQSGSTDYIKAVNNAFNLLIDSIPKQDENTCREAVRINDQFTEYLNPLGTSPKPYVLFLLYVSLLNKRQQEENDATTPYTVQLLFGKDSFVDKIKALITANHSTEFQKFIESTDDATFQLIKAHYGLDNSKLMAEYQKILTSVTAATNSLVSTFKNFQNDIISLFWKKQPATTSPTKISEPYNFKKSDENNPVKQILQNSKQVSDEVVQSSSFESFYNTENVFLQEQNETLQSKRAIFDEQIKGFFRDEDSDYCQQALDFQDECLTYLTRLLNPSEDDLASQGEFSYDKYAEVKGKFEVCQNEYTNFLESLGIFQNPNNTQQAEVENVEVDNNQTPTLNLADIATFDKKTHSIRLTIARRTQLFNQNPVAEEDTSFGFG